MGTFKRRWDRFYKWYIKGCYHCDKCPMYWSECFYDGSDYAGCYVFGEPRDTCRLLPPLRWIAGWPRKKRHTYRLNHEWDNVGEFLEKRAAQQDIMADIMAEALTESLAKYELVFRLDDGSMIPICKAEYVRQNAPRLQRKYENAAHPVKHPTLKQEWKRVLRKTWDSFTGIFKPYFSE